MDTYCLLTIDLERKLEAALAEIVPPLSNITLLVYNFPSYCYEGSRSPIRELHWQCYIFRTNNCSNYQGDFGGGAKDTALDQKEHFKLQY